MKQTLIEKYLQGETSGREERELERLLRETPSDERSPRERALLALLSSTAPATGGDDLFEADHSAQYERTVKHRRARALWPLTAAACIAVAVAVWILPHRPTQPSTLSQQLPPPPAATRPIPPHPAPATAVPAPPAKPSQSAEPLPSPAETHQPRPGDMAAATPAPDQTLREEQMLDAIINEILTNALQQTGPDEYTL